MEQGVANIVWHPTKVERGTRVAITRVRPAVLWLTGLSGSGKSSVAMALEEVLVGRGYGAYVLDGDNVRHGLNKNLGFSPGDRVENIRRVGEVGKLFVEAGFLTISSFISPYRADREAVRALLGEGEFLEVYVDAPLAVCEGRDPKGLYKKARAAAAGQGLAFTGIDAPYEAPERPEIHLHTERQDVPACVGEIVSFLERGGYLVGDKCKVQNAKS